MQRKIVLFAGISLLLTPIIATAEQPQAAHDVFWYANHPAERSATLRTCQSDNSYAHLYDCRNASSGELLATARANLAASNFLADPNWWNANPTARDGVVRICAHPEISAYPMYAPYCNIVRATSILARRA